MVEAGTCAQGTVHPLLRLGCRNAIRNGDVHCRPELAMCPKFKTAGSNAISAILTLLIVSKSTRRCEDAVGSLVEYLRMML